MEFQVTTDLALIQPQKIESNVGEVKVWLQSALTKYKTAVVSEDAISSAKADRATVNKVKKAIDDKRKLVKKQWNEPYVAWEKEVNELVALCDEAAKNLDVQIKSFETEAKEVKKAKLKSCLEGWAAGVGVEDYLPYDEVADPRWLNATFPMEEATGAIRKLIQVTAEDLRTIRDLHSDFETALLNKYKQTRDIRKVLAEEQSLRAVREREASRREFIPPQTLEPSEPNAIRSEKTEELKTEPITSAQPQNPVAEPVLKLQSKPAKTWTLKFAVTVTKEQMFALKNFFVSNGIHYEQLEERKENK